MATNGNITMKRIYKNTDLNFPISLLPVTENEQITVKFFTRSDLQYIRKTNDDIIDNHIVLTWQELSTLDEGILNVWVLTSSYDDNLPDNSYDVAEVRNTPYYIVTGKKDGEESIENFILNNYYTKDEIDDKLEHIDVDLTGYAKKATLTQAEYDALTEKDPDTIYIITDAETDYYSKEEVDNKVANVTVDLTGYATETWVNEQLQDIEVDVDLTAYYTKEEVDNAIENIDIPTVDLGGYATEQWVENKGYITGVDLSNYATEAWVNEQLQDIPTGADIAILKYNHQTNVFDGDFNATLEAIKDTTKPFAIYLPYGTSEYLQASYVMPAGTQIYAIADIASSSKIEHYIFAINADGSYTKNVEEIALGGGSGNVDLTNYYNKQEVDDKVANVSVDLTGYATEEWIKEQDYTRQTLVTMAEYEAMEKEENVMYIITDVEDEWVGTQAEYDALPTKNPDTTYFIIEG